MANIIQRPSERAVPRRVTGADAVAESARPSRGRRLSWEEFYLLRPDRRPANDNISNGKQEAA